MNKPLKFRRVEGTFSIVQLPTGSAVPTWAQKEGLFSITRTPDELSIVCRRECVPPDVKNDRRWVCFKLEGPFAFSEVGILASFIAPLADAGIPIFAISTYDTDYVLIPEELTGMALAALNKAGHQLVPDDAN